MKNTAFKIKLCLLLCVFLPAFSFSAYPQNLPLQFGYADISQSKVLIRNINISVSNNPIDTISKDGMSRKQGKIEESLQEFFTGETVYAQRKNEIQATSKPAYWKEDGLETINIPLQLEYGLSNRFQIELTLPYNFVHPEIGQRANGPGSMEVGFLYNMVNSKPFALSLAMDVGFATAKKEQGTEELEWEPSLIVARKVGRAQVHAGLTAEITRSESALNYNLATVFPFGDWRATLELNGDTANEKTMYLTHGLIWKGLDDLEFGAALSKSISKNRGEWGAVLMITHEFSFTGTNKQN